MMKAKMSRLGKAFLKNPKASSALVYAIATNPRDFSMGKNITFEVATREGNKKVSVKKANL